MAAPGTVKPNDEQAPARLERRGGVLTLTITESQIGSAEATQIQGLAASEVDRAGKSLRALVIDLSAVTYMNSMGLGVCIELRNRAAGLPARCIVFGMQKKIAELFRLMNVDRLFEIAPDAAELTRLLR